MNWFTNSPSQTRRSSRILVCALASWVGVATFASEVHASTRIVGRIEPVTFPVAAPHAFSNSWGWPRPGGRSHKGTDIFAACGAEVVAVRDASVKQMHAKGNGGTMLWLRGANSDVFFYAHLRKYAAGLRVGQRVLAGQLVGYNGDSGNAKGSGCHVHFEWHPADRGAVNPYFLLKASDY